MKTKRKMNLSLLCGILGSLCFGVGDWLLGYVDPTPIGENIFYFISAGHGAGYDALKIVVTLVMAMVGMCFLIPGMTGSAEVARKSGTKKLLRYLFALCTVGWIVIHFGVAVNVLVFSIAERAGGRELAISLSHDMNSSLSAVPLLRLCVCGGGSDYADRPDPLREDPPETDSGAVYSCRSDGDHIRRFRASACVALCLRAVNLLHEWWADCLVCISSASSRYGYGGLHK